jgi:lipoteichoic acid synthase
MATGRSYGRLDIIPRPKKYNIILYFFESTPYKYYDIKIGNTYLVGTWHRLEKNSVNFRNHYANYPLSANALMTVLTSAYDMNSKDMVIQKYPDIRLHTLPEILKERGYMTCLIHTGGLGYAGQKRFLMHRKFDEIIEYNQLVKLPPYNRQVGWGVDERAMIGPALEFMKKNPGSPRLLVLMPVNPHHPYAIPDDTFRISHQASDDQNDKKRHWHNYCNSLYYSDASLGMLIDELERAGLMENTLLFLFADHGEAFYQHRMNYNHPLYIYDENVHVPFLIYNKRLINSPEYITCISRHIDILPTILDILGIPGSPEQEGVSLLSPRREQMALLHTSWKDDYTGIVDQQWKYIYRTDNGIEEMYDLYEDPDEKNNIVLKHPDLAERYRSFISGARQYKNEYFRRILAK